MSARLTQVLIQILLARLLIPAEYSLFFYYYSAITGLSMFIGESLGLTSSRFLSTATGDLRSKTNMTLMAGFLGACIASLLILLHARYLSNELIQLNFALVLIVYSFNLCYSGTLQYVAIAIGQRQFLAKMQLTLSVISLATTSYVAKNWGWTTALTNLGVLVFVANAILLSKFFDFKTARVSWSKSFREILYVVKSALPICGSMALGGPVHVYCISVLKNAPTSTAAEVGVFGISFIFYTLLSFMPGAFGQFLVPWLLKHTTRTPENAFSMISKFYALIGTTLFVAVVIADSAGLSRLIPTLENAEHTILLLSGAGLVAGFVTLYSFYLNSIYKSTTVLFSSVCHSTVYVGMTYVLVEYLRMGAAGLAAALLIASFGQLTILFVKKKRLRYQDRNFRSRDE